MGKHKEREAAEQPMETEVDPLAELTYEEKLAFICPIAKPMASKKLTKRLYKLISKACKDKTSFRNGIKDCQKRIRKGERSLIILAGDVTPVDTYSHLAGLCETHELPYCYVPSKQDLGKAMGVKRSTLVVSIKKASGYQELYEDCLQEVKKLPIPV